MMRNSAMRSILLGGIVVPLIVPPALGEDAAPEPLKEGWTKTVPIPLSELGEGDRYVLSVEAGWLHVKRETGAGTTDWHIVLARVTDPTPPEIVAVEGKLPFAVSYRNGKYFIREYGGMLRCVREHKQEGEGCLSGVPETSNWADAAEFKPLPAGSVAGWTHEGWFIAASGPDRGSYDCLIRLNPEDRSSPGYGTQAVQGGLCSMFHGKTRIVDDGEMLIVERTLEAVDRARRKREAVLAGLVGSPAPALDGTKWLNAEAPLSWEALKGRVVLLDFWATTCTPCVKKLPQMQALYEKHRDNGLVVVGIHQTADSSEEFEEFSKRLQLTFPLMMDSGETAKRYAVESLPTYLLVDSGGKIIRGPSIHPPAEEEIERLLDGEFHDQP